MCEYMAEDFIFGEVNLPNILYDKFQTHSQSMKRRSKSHSPTSYRTKTGGRPRSLSPGEVTVRNRNTYGRVDAKNASLSADALPLSWEAFSRHSQGTYTEGDTRGRSLRREDRGSSTHDPHHSRSNSTNSNRTDHHRRRSSSSGPPAGLKYRQNTVIKRVGSSGVIVDADNTAGIEEQISGNLPVSILKRRPSLAVSAPPIQYRIKKSASSSSYNIKNKVIEPSDSPPDISSDDIRRKQRVKFSINKYTAAGTGASSSGDSNGSIGRSSFNYSNNTYPSFRQSSNSSSVSRSSSSSNGSGSSTSSSNGSSENDKENRYNMNPLSRPSTSSTLGKNTRKNKTVSISGHNSGSDRDSDRDSGISKVVKSPSSVKTRSQHQHQYQSRLRLKSSKSKSRSRSRSASPKRPNDPAVSATLGNSPYDTIIHVGSSRDSSLGVMEGRDESSLMLDPALYKLHKSNNIGGRKGKRCQQRAYTDYLPHRSVSYFMNGRNGMWYPPLMTECEKATARMDKFPLITAAQQHAVRQWLVTLGK